MANTTVNKVEYGGQTVIDITDTTAETNEVLNGKVFYAKSGARSVGTLGDMTGATVSTDGAAGLVPAPTSSDVGKFLSADGTWGDGGKPMVILSYGSSTWNDFINAYNNRVIVYCRASSNSNPASGSQTRMAFMAYVNDASSPTQVEFQYYRSVNPNNKSVSAMCDEVYVYTLKNTGAWSVAVRAASVKEIILNSGLSSTYDKNTGKLTMSLTDATTSAHGAMSAADKTALDALNTFFTASGLGIDSSGYITQTL